MIIYDLDIPIKENEVLNADGDGVTQADIDEALGQVGQAKDTIDKIKNLFKSDGMKKELRNACGRKPLKKSKRDEWNKCAANYMIAKAGGTTVTTASAPTAASPYASAPAPVKSNKILGMSPVTFGLVALGVLSIGAYLVLRKK